MLSRSLARDSAPLRTEVLARLSAGPGSDAMRGNAVGNVGARPDRGRPWAARSMRVGRHAPGHEQFFLSSCCDAHPRRTQLGHTPHSPPGPGMAWIPGQRLTDQCAIRLPRCQLTARMPKSATGCRGPSVPLNPVTAVGHRAEPGRCEHGMPTLRRRLCRNAVPRRSCPIDHIRRGCAGVRHLRG